MDRIALVVADEEEGPKGLRTALATSAINAVVAADALGAMLALGRARFGVVVVLKRMKSSSLNDLCRVARLRHPGIPIHISRAALAGEAPVDAGVMLFAGDVASDVAVEIDAAFEGSAQWEASTAPMVLANDTVSDPAAPALLEGELGDGVGATVLMSIWAQELTGCLRVDRGPAGGDLYFLTGEPVAAEALLGGEANVRERVMATVDGQEGAYAFYPDSTFVGHRPLTRVNPFGLMLEARRRRMPPASILDAHARIDHKYVHPGVGLDRAAQRILPFTRGVDVSTIMNGTNTAREVFAAAGLDVLMGTLVLLTLEDARLVSLALKPEAVKSEVILGKLITAVSTIVPDVQSLSFDDEVGFDSDAFDATLDDNEQPREPTGSAMRYEILERIGGGGMAEVFLARAVSTEGLFEKRVALKRILPELSRNPQFVAMFLEEARVAARVSHPNVVQMFDLGCAGNDYYIVMEYVAGVDLQTLLEHAKSGGMWMPFEIAARIVSDISAGLHAAHSYVDASGQTAPIIHRDVSPQNVLLSGDGHVKLTDFGIAKPADSRLQTETGGWKGKRSYLSPEYLNGAAADARSDVFVTGIILYMCIGLAHPFSRVNAADTVNALLNADFVPLSSLRPDVPEALAAIVARALTREPDHRYQSARALQLALDSFAASTGRAAFAPQVAGWAHDVMAAQPLPQRDAQVLGPTRIVLHGIKA